MKKQLKNPFKNTKIKAFLFFLFLATLFWVLTKYSKQYTSSATTDIHYINIPSNTMLASNNLKSIDFNLTTNGFEFLFFKFNKPTVSIDVNSYYKKGAKQAIVPNSELVRLISLKLKSNISVKELSVKDLTIKLDEMVSKKVPVISQVEFNFKNGFRQVDSISVVPDSITISGPSEVIDTIKVIKTEIHSETNIEKSLTKQIKLINPEASKLSFDIKEVSIKLKVVEFSQKEIILKVEMINVPEKTIIKLIPEIVTVTFDASVEEFKDISKQEFQLVCDYAERNKEENFMIPKLVKHPKGIVNIEIDSEKIDYLIFQ